MCRIEIKIKLRIQWNVFDMKIREIAIFNKYACDYGIEMFMGWMPEMKML